MLFDGLYDAIYNKVEEAGLAIQDVVSSATCPDVDKYLNDHPSSSDDDKNKKKTKGERMSSFVFFLLFVPNKIDNGTP